MQHKREKALFNLVGVGTRQGLPLLISQSFELGREGILEFERNLWAKEEV